MMNEQLRWARKLNKLIKRNFQIARTYSKLIEAIPSESIKRILGQHISRIMECAKELELEINSLEIEEILTKKSIYRTDFISSPIKLLGTNAPLLLRYCIKQKKTSIKLYRKTLTRINEGSIREILIRHISLFEADLNELRLLEIRLSTRKNRNNSILSS